MTKYREIIRLAELGLSQTNIALSCNASKTTVNKVLKAAREQNLTWPLDPKLTDPVLCGLLFPNQKAKVTTSKRMPDYAHIRKELLRNGVNKKLLWTEYLEECRLAGDEPLMYSQFCYYIQQVRITVLWKICFHGLSSYRKSAEAKPKQRMCKPAAGKRRSKNTLVLMIYRVRYFNERFKDSGRGKTNSTPRKDNLHTQNICSSNCTIKQTC